MKKLFAVMISVALCIGSLAGCSGSTAKQPANKLEEVLEKGTLVVATSPDFAPTEFLDLSKTGQDAVVGADISFAYYVAEQLGVELVIEQMAFEACLAAVPAGKVDVSISGFASTPEREENMECSDGYEWEGSSIDGHGLLMLAEDAPNYKTAEDFAGMTIAAQLGSIQYEYAVAELPSDVKIEPISNLGDATLMLLNGKVDAVASSIETGTQYAESYDTLAMADFEFANDSTGGAVVLAKKGETELMAEINKIIAKATEEGLFPVWYEEAAALADSLGIEN